MGTFMPSDKHRISINISTRVAKHMQVSLDWRNFGMVSEVKSQVRSTLQWRKSPASSEGQRASLLDFLCSVVNGSRQQLLPTFIGGELKSIAI